MFKRRILVAVLAVALFVGMGGPQGVLHIASSAPAALVSGQSVDDPALVAQAAKCTVDIVVITPDGELVFIRVECEFDF
ncbi:MAG: hypothetical protein ABEK03_05570 [Candidatus Bipolaricaulia bacterium]